jgi:heat shock protein HtpX
MVENLAITAGVPTPRVYIIPSQSLNAFATGRDPEHAAIALTTGIVEKLENEELEGVVAHELSHIKNYDIRLMTLVVVLVGTIVLLSDYMFRWGFIFGGRSRNSQAGRWIAILGLVLLLISPIIAELIRLAVSRKREFLADASGALLTRYPEGLAKALEKISAAQPMEQPSRATAHLFIASPFGGKSKTGFLRLFSTHPPAVERIAALREMI